MKSSSQTIPLNSHDINSNSQDLEKRPLESETEPPKTNMFTTRLLLLSAALLSTILLISSHQALAAVAASSSKSNASISSSSPRDFEPVTAPSGFPTSAFSSYYLDPTGTLDEPRPIITDVARNDVYPDSLDNPTMLPTVSFDLRASIEPLSLTSPLFFRIHLTSGSSNRQCSATKSVSSSESQR